MPTLIIRRYLPDDYPAVVKLYMQSDTYGGQFNDDRDSADALLRQSMVDPDAILIAEENREIVGTVSLIENARVAWLFRFAVGPRSDANFIEQALHESACTILRNRGHKEVLVYSPAGHRDLTQRYQKLGFSTGGAYTCFWKTL